MKIFHRNLVAMPRFLVALSLITLFCSGTAQALTPQQVSEAFIRGISDYCIKAISAGVSISKISTADMEGLTPSSSQQKQLLGSESESPAWDVASGSGIVMIYEPRPGVCKVIAYGPPVELTFSEALRRAEKRYPEFTDAKVKNGYDPIAFGLRKGVGLDEVRVDLHGAEPGSPGHAFRFSMLHATISRGGVVGWDQTKP